MAWGGVGIVGRKRGGRSFSVLRCEEKSIPRGFVAFVVCYFLSGCAVFIIIGFMCFAFPEDVFF